MANGAPASLSAVAFTGEAIAGLGPAAAFGLFHLLIKFLCHTTCSGEWQASVTSYSLGIGEGLLA